MARKPSIAVDPKLPRLRPDGSWAREDGAALWVVMTSANRVIVWAHNEDQAWRAFVDEKFPTGTNGARLAPPIRSTCIVRLARDDEAAEFVAVKRRRSKPTQATNLFDVSKFDDGKAKGKSTGDVTERPNAKPRANARTADPITSHQAAASVSSPKIIASRAAVLRVLRDLGEGTDEDIAVRYETRRIEWGLPKQSPSGLRTRRSELVEADAVRNSGRKSTLASGNSAIVWVPIGQ